MSEPMTDIDVAPANILVVDDIEMNRDLLVRRLQRSGHVVTQAVNGKEALDKLGTTPFDLVLLDIMMPIMDGHEVLTAMKDDAALREIPVIVISAAEEVETAVKCIKAGAEDFLPKPFNATILKARIGASLRKKRHRDRELEYQRRIDAERQRGDELLRALFPGSVVKRLKETDEFTPQRFPDVAVLFADIVGFTPYCDCHKPEEVVADLQRMIEQFEIVSGDHQLEKIKTVGDAFMATAGLLEPVDDPVLNCLNCGLAMLDAVRKVTPHWQLRVGIHAGPVVAGVVGKKRYCFDVWGDTVNTAQRVEGHGTPGAVNFSGDAWQRIADRCRGESRRVAVKGKGELEIVRFEAYA
jgi:adenylate cyclase